MEPRVLRRFPHEGLKTENLPKQKKFLDADKRICYDSGIKMKRFKNETGGVYGEKIHRKQFKKLYGTGMV